MTETPGAPPTYADDARRYRLDARIATGGMGEVWRATDTNLGREVAVKVLKNEYADDPSFRARFEVEAQHAGSLHHPNIATVYDYGSGGGRPFLVMELVDGQPLSAVLRPDTPMDPDAVRELLTQAADGLGAAHAAGIVHRDVKPANLLVTPDRRVKVTDFGIARAAEGLGLTQTGEVMGTPQYLSPEQAQGQTATPASDVYSLGVVAFECLAGHRPFQADTAVATALAHLREPVPELPETVPGDLAAVVRRSMAKLPQDRFADGAAFAAALRDPHTAVTQAAAPPPASETMVMAPVVPGPTAGHLPEDDERVRHRTALWPVLAVLALVVVVILAVVLIAQAMDDEAPTDEPTHSPTASHPKSDTTPTSEPTTTSPTPTSTPTPTPTPSDTPTPTPTESDTPTPTPTPTPSDTSTPSDTATTSSASPGAVEPSATSSSQAKDTPR
ncbi:serine/threonine-protein kinase [Nocardioides sp. URHA0032]|uniref:serine/threonine-protein kinase n=1 Tax=Nocardioides sp. URHA0032 TaxID=1380388 RepID=UPI0006861B1B|nr:serine/threonine-protein kinase [Nocardioides sp. URHA0032]